jgi:hypothetical protein
MADTGMEEPSFSTVQSAAVKPLFSAAFPAVKLKRQTRLIARKNIAVFLVFPFIAVSPVFNSRLN